MIDFKIHKEEQLFSIKGISDDSKSHKFFYSLLFNLLKDTGYGLIHTKRNNYETSVIAFFRDKNESQDIKDLKIANDLFELSFYFDNHESGKSILIGMIDLWDAFQHTAYYFFPSEKLLKLNYEKILMNNYSWKEIVTFSSCFMLFKGAEEDVIWLAKSSNLKFKSGVPPQK
ncbi:MAG: hypothetical protein ACRBFS_13925 [Aureispira sp.]